VKRHVYNPKLAKRRILINAPYDSMVIKPEVIKSAIPLHQP